MKKGLFFLLVLGFTFSCEQKENLQTDNQKRIIENYRKFNLLIKINTDSITYYSNSIEKLAQNETNRYRAISKTVKGIEHINFAAYDLAIKNYRESSELLKNSKNDTLVAKNYIGIGESYLFKGDLTKALEHYYKGLKIYEALNKKGGIAFAYNQIADVYLTKTDIPNTIKYLNKSLEILKDQPENRLYLIASHTMANAYGMSGDLKKALEIDNKNLKICDKIKSDKLKVMFLDNKANCFMYGNQLDSAQIYFDKCLILDKKIGNPKQIADNYSNQSILASMKNDLPLSEKFALESIAILKKIENKTNILNSYQVLYDLYEKQGKYKEALQVKNDLFTTYKSMITAKKEAASIEFQEIYESEKKTRQIIQQQAQAKQNRIYLIGITILALLTGLIGFLIYRQQKQKNIQQTQEHDLKSAISLIENQNKLQEQRLNISRDLHDNIGAQLTFIISSVDNIKYAFDITNEKLDNKLNNISSFAKETIVELRDTIWAMNSNEITFEDLEIRINNYIEKAKEAKDQISFSFAIDPVLKTQKLTSIQGMNVYRTIQEAVNNAIKYANASVISINAKQAENLLKITIQDNGIGFEIASKLAMTGNGLQNMQKRIEEIGGEFHLSSSNEGTRIEILI